MQLSLPVIAACVATLHVANGYTPAQLSESDLDFLIEEDADLFALADATAAGLQRSVIRPAPTPAPAPAPPSKGYTLAQLSQEQMDALIEEDSDLFALGEAISAGLQRSAAKVSTVARAASPETETCSAARGGKRCAADAASTKQEIASHTDAREATLRRITDARGIRQLEADNFAAERKEGDNAIGSLDRVMLVLMQERKNNLERKDVAAVQDIVQTHVGMMAFDRNKVLSFFPTALLGSWKQDDAAKVVDALGTLRDALVKDRDAAIANDDRSKREFDDLVAKNEMEASQLLKKIADLM